MNCRNSFVVFPVDSLKISVRFENWLFLPFIFSEWSPPQVLPDWKRGRCCWTSGKYRNAMAAVLTRRQKWSIKVLMALVLMAATPTASVSVPTCFGQHLFPLFSHHGVKYMTRVTLLLSFTSLDWHGQCGRVVRPTPKVAEVGGLCPCETPLLE